MVPDPLARREVVVFHVVRLLVGSQMVVFNGTRPLAT